MSVKLSSKYQVVIPEEVRKLLQLKPGQIIDVIAKGGVAYLVPVKSLDKLKGSLSEKLSLSEQKNLREKTDRKL